MEELVPLVRRLWRLHDGPVRHDGRFYHLDVSPVGEMSPPLRDTIPIYTGGINPRMIEAAGRVADGLVGHPLFTLAYINDVVRPAIERGAAHAERDPGDIGLAHMVICAVSDDETAARQEAAAQIALYAATKAYSGMLDIAGFAREGEAIRSAFARRDIDGMIAAVSDPLIDAVAITGDVRHVRAGLRRFDGVVDQLIAYAPNINMSADQVEERVRSLLEVAAGPED